MERLKDALFIFAVLAVMLFVLALVRSMRDGSVQEQERFLGFDNIVVNKALMNDTGKQTACMFAAGQVDDLCDGNVNIQNRMYFGDKYMGTQPGKNDNTDSYYMEKVRANHGDGSPDDVSSLRLTINDNAEESLEVWGNSCAAGNCGGDGKRGHRLRADGSVGHSGGMVIGHPDAVTPADAGWTWGSYPSGAGLNVYNRHANNWTHFPWAGDGRNYIRNDTVVNGTLRVAQYGADENHGIAAFGNAGQDGASRDKYNGGLDSWYGIGFRCRMDGQTRFVHDTRTGDVKLHSGNGSSAKLCIDDVCISANDIRNMKSRIASSSASSSGSAVFELGPYNMGPWGMTGFVDTSAKWIWNEAGAAFNAGNGCATYEKVFTSNSDVDVVVHIACDNIGQVFLNGTDIGRANGGWNGTGIKLNGKVTKGQNVIRVQARNMGGPAGILVAVATSNNTVLVRSNSSWRWSHSCDAMESSSARTKEGNNGTVSCDTYCAGEEWGGFKGVCISGHQDGKGQVACDEVAGYPNNVTCECLV